MTNQETDAVIVAVEDAVIQSMPATVPMPKQIDYVNRIRREVARVLKSADHQQPT